MLRGMMTTMKIGVAMQIITRVLTMPKKHITQLRRVWGSMSSTVEIS